MTIKGLLFDKDGTLIDFDATWGPAGYEVMRALAGGERPALERLMEVSLFVEAERRFLPASPLVGGSSAEYGPLWADALGREPSADLYREMDELFRHWGLATLTPIGEPRAILSALAARGLRLGVATNDAEASARAQLDALGLSGLVGFVAGYDSGYGSKPEPGMIEAFASHQRLRPSEVAVIGDSLHDLLAARAAGSLAVAVLTGPLKGAARSALGPHADHVIGSIADLAAWLEAIEPRPRVRSAAGAG